MSAMAIAALCGGCFAVGSWTGRAWARIAISPFWVQVGKFTFMYDTNSNRSRGSFKLSWGESVDSSILPVNFGISISPLLLVFCT